MDKNSFESKEGLSPFIERFFILGGLRGFQQKDLRNLRLNAIGGVFSGTRNNIISWIVKLLSILVVRTSFAGPMVMIMYDLRKKDIRPKNIRSHLSYSLYK